MPSTEYFKTIDPYLYSVNLYYNKDYFRAFSNYYKVLVFGIDTLQYFIEYNKSKVIDNPIDARVQLYKELDSTGMDTYQQLQFKIYWYEKFFSDLNLIKETFFQQVEDTIYFKEISDSIGLLRNYFCVPDDSTLLIKDTNFTVQTSDGIPLPVNVGSGVYNKLRTNTILLSTEINFLNTVLYRNNMSNLQENFTYPNEAHGENLVTDFNYIDKIKNISQEVLEKSLRQFYGQLYDLILFYENFDYGNYDQNLAKMEKGAIEVSIEGVTKKITYLQQQATQYVNMVNLYTTLTAQTIT